MEASIAFFQSTGMNHTDTCEEVNSGSNRNAPSATNFVKRDKGGGTRG